MGDTAVLQFDPGWPHLGSGGDGRRSPLAQSLLLAVLLHVLLVALVGTVPGQGLPQGEPAWGPLRIRLEGARGSDARGQAEQARLSPREPGLAPAARYGGLAPQAPPAPTPDPGAPDIGPRRPQAAAGQQAEQAPPAPHAIDRVPPAPPPPVFERAPAPAPVRVPAPDGNEPAPRQSVVQDSAATDERASSTAPRLAPLPTVEAPALRRPAQAAPEIAVPDVQAAAPAAPAPTPTREAARLLPAPAGATAVEPVAPVPALSAPPAPPQPPLLQAPAPAAPPRAPLPEAAWPAAPLAPPASARAAPAPTLAPVDAQTLPAGVGIEPPRLLPSLRADGVAGGVAGTAGAAPAAPLMRPAPAAAGAEPADAAAAAAGAASGPARLRLELPMARPLSPGLASPRLLNLVPPPPRKSPLAQGIEKSARPDCRKAYSGMGALAAIPLAVDALRDGGCRW